VGLQVGQHVISLPRKWVGFFFPVPALDYDAFNSFHCRETRSHELQTHGDTYSRWLLLSERRIVSLDFIAGANSVDFPSASYSGVNK
jgi:hypothetical protein